MKRVAKNVRSHRGMFGPVVTVVVLASALYTARAEAGVRVDVRLRTPHVEVVVGSGDTRCGMPVGPRVERMPIVINRYDRKLARSLARRYDCSRDDLLDLRRDGYSWSEIRGFLCLPPRQMHAALHPHRPVQVRCGNSVEFERGHHRHDGRRDDR
jgi:hypothetical protein